MQVKSKGFWSTVLQPDQRLRITPGAPLKLTHVAVHHNVANPLSRASLILTYRPRGSESDVSAVIGSFVQSYMTRSMTCEVLLMSKDSYVFESRGGYILHLSGHFVDQELPSPETVAVLEAIPSSNIINATQKSRGASNAVASSSGATKSTTSSVAQGKRRQSDASEVQSTSQLRRGSRASVTASTDDGDITETDRKAPQPPAKKKRRMIDED